MVGAFLRQAAHRALHSSSEQMFREGRGRPQSRAVLEVGDQLAEALGTEEPSSPPASS